VEEEVYDRDPKLDPVGLKDNGGPTETVALLADSPAIDAGTGDYDGVPEKDQRGVKRPQGKGYDIGAYEYVPGDGGGSSGGCSAVGGGASALLLLLPLAALALRRK
jgi:Synergist-CTERM protein sorting domain-containing protein